MTATVLTDSGTPSTARTRRSRWALGAVHAVRVLVITHLALVLAQPVLAGGYLGGDYDQLALHAVGADLVSYTGYVLVVSTLGLALLGGSRWTLLAAAVLVTAESGQYVAGLDGALALHVPLGVAIVSATVVLTVLLWATPASRIAVRAA